MTATDKVFVQTIERFRTGEDTRVFELFYHEDDYANSKAIIAVGSYEHCYNNIPDYYANIPNTVGEYCDKDAIDWFTKKKGSIEPSGILVSKRVLYLKPSDICI